MARIYDETSPDEVDWIEGGEPPQEDDDAELQVVCPICDRAGDAELLFTERVVRSVGRRWSCGCGATWSTIEAVSSKRGVLAPPAAMEAVLRDPVRRRHLSFGIYSYEAIPNLTLLYHHNSGGGDWEMVVHGGHSYKARVRVGRADTHTANGRVSFEQALTHPKVTRALELMALRIHEADVIYQARQKAGLLGLAAPPPDTSE